ncbi:MAG: flagellar hook-length control protein FliK [Lachnospiraceae bacterium]|nr:flagellar hook-length control protein FliK [Lachnospiraceae bacterium]
MSMQISDLVNQYQNSLAAGSEISTKTKGIEQLTKTVAGLQEGQVFEGTVNSMKNGTVVLGLSSGQNITARLDKGVQLVQGQSVFFQVKSNEGGLIQIKPISIGTANNPTLLNALDAANLPVNEKTLNMVNAMMKEQMPIDAKSVIDMSRQVTLHPQADVHTVVSLNKLGIPVTDGMAAQFENYQNSEGAILKTVEDLAREIPTLLDGEDVSKETVIAFQKTLVEGIFDKPQEMVMTQAGLQAVSGEAATIAEPANYANTQAASLMEQMAQVESSEANVVSTTTQGTTETAVGGTTAAPTPYEITISAEEPLSETVGQSDAFGKLVAELDGASYDKGTLGNALQPSQSQELTQLVRQFPGFTETYPQDFDTNGALKPELPVAEVMKQLTNYMDTHTNITKADVMRLVKSDAYNGLFKELFAKEWTLEPEEITQPGKIEELYRKINQDTERLQQAAHRVTDSANVVTQTAAGIRDNLSFITEINQMYTYVQLPLQLNHQHTTGDLYVYTNRKHARGEDDEVSAFLHFDLEHLGSTDIAVRLKNKDVKTQFYLEDEISFQLVQNNIHLLEEKLNNLGYHCQVDVINDSNDVNFVEDFLMKDVKTGGPIQRYSFDVRA